MEDIFEDLQTWVQQDWLASFIVGGAIIGCTILLSVLCGKIVRRLLKESSTLPENSIFLNIIRVCIWLCGVGLVLSICFGINVSALITALGVGGIAISLGLQDTLSNLIGGLEVSLSKLIKPGDTIQVNYNGASGVVQDVAWRQTTLIDANGQTIYIPNSYISTYAVTKLAPWGSISIPIVVNTTNQRLTDVAHQMEKAAKAAVSRVCKIKSDPSVNFTGIGDFGFIGTVTMVIEDNHRAAAAKDAAVRAMAPYAHANAISDVAVAVDDVAEVVS